MKLKSKKECCFAKLNNCPHLRKMRLIADLIRGMDVEKALAELKFNPKEASNRMEKLLLSALANWEVKNEGKILIKKLFVSVRVDSGRMLKRIQPAPREEHTELESGLICVTLTVDSRKNTKNNMGQKQIQ